MTTYIILRFVKNNTGGVAPRGCCI